MTTTFSLRLLLLRGRSPKNADSHRSERLLLLGLGLCSRVSADDGRPDDVEDRGGVFSCRSMNSDVGSL